eukprot:Awhi_evm1s1869
MKVISAIALSALSLVSAQRDGTVANPIRFAYTGEETNLTVVKGLLDGGLSPLVFEVVKLGSDIEATNAITAGTVDIADVDAISAIKGWNKQQKVLAAEVTDSASQRTFYKAVAWVLADSGIEDFSGLRGKRSCHTGFLKSAGMVMPVGGAIKMNKLPVIAEGFDSRTQLRDTVVNYFSSSCAPPTLCGLCSDDKVDGYCSGGSENLYSGYQGAFRCLSEGKGDVAFVRDTTYDEYCTGDKEAENSGWCQNKDAYKVIEDFGEVPTHPIMTGENSLTSEAEAGLIAALVAIPPTSTDLLNIFSGNANGFKEVKTYDHLNTYRSNLACVPSVDSLLDIDRDSVGVCDELTANTVENRNYLTSDASSEPVSSNNDYDHSKWEGIAIAGLTIACLAFVLTLVVVGIVMTTKNQSKGYVQQRDNGLQSNSQINRA